MEALIEAEVRAGVVAAVARRGEDLVATADLHAADDWTPLTGDVHALSSAPLIVAGRLPAGVVDVRVLWPGDWASVDVRDGAWLAVARESPGSEQPTWGLAFVLDDGSMEPVPDIDEDDAVVEPLEIGEPNDEARAYAAALAEAIAADVAADEIPGALRRIVVRWFWNGDPEYLTIHALAAGDAQPAVEDAWYPLEWDVDEREFRRTDRVLAVPAVRAAAAALTATFPTLEDGEVDDLAHVPAIYEAVRRLPEALIAHEVPLAERFAVAAAHFEGWGALDSLRATAPGELIDALEEHGELPTE